MHNEPNPRLVKRHVSRSTAAGITLELSYLAGCETGKGNPLNTGTVARLLDTSCAQQEAEIWRREFGDPFMPTAAWLDWIKLTAIVRNRLFVAVSDTLLELSRVDGTTIWQIVTGNTVIDHILGLEKTARLLVLNRYYQFEHPTGVSNLCAVDLAGYEIWRTALPDKNDVFVGPPRYRDDKVEANTWNCLHCTLDPDTGEILKSLFTK